MTKKNKPFPTMSKGVRKYIRKEKARIRRELNDPQEQYQEIRSLYERVAPAKKTVEETA